MGQLIVRRVDDRIIRVLEQRAAGAERRAVRAQVLVPDGFAEAAARLRARGPKQSSDAAALIARDRDRDHGGAAAWFPAS